ncbi:SIR2 family protein [Heliorestis convoluta]|uniref:Uncharacterized protein n=1 Tax=Heliorestis convoluta TaxID=356322 RepID=A0A5Q2N0M5_9FIRM|nr:SIR2 family protein [Heliorestis convoluta]QGG48874.1 hypothetical protein FTV88_2785 [Heliorestis convoluta]
MWKKVGHCLGLNKKKRVTAFLGAGSSIEIGGPLATDLTSKVRNKKQIFQGKNVDFINNIAKTLNNSYKNNQGNFEDIFHVLEMLTSLNRSWRAETAKKYKTPISAFVKKNNVDYFNDDLILLAKKDLIEEIADEIYRYDYNYDPKNQHKWYNDFWNKGNSRFNWDIYTLNYDTCIEKSLPVYKDGFERIDEGFCRFNPRDIVETNDSRIVHLHGSILYGYPKFRSSNKYALEDSFEDLYKYQSYNEAKATWFGRSTNTAQSSDEAIAGPIITGLRKSDKLLHYPYSLYNHLFNFSLLTSSRLLIVGYSFGDLHYNSWLNSMLRLHGKNRRIVLITMADEKEWHCDPAVMSWLNHDTFSFVSRSFNDFNPFKSLSFNSPLVSEDGCARLYLCGFKEAAENHGMDIINFLSS